MLENEATIVIRKTCDEILMQFVRDTPLKISCHLMSLNGDVSTRELE